MLIASKRKLKQFSGNLNITIGSHNIKQVVNKKVLGIILDEELKWREHIDAQCKKISKSIALLRRAKSFVTSKTLITMCNSLVLLHFTYCSTIFCIHNNKLSKMQKRAARVITGSNYEIRSGEIFESLGWEPIENILKKREITMTFKAMQDKLPGYMSEMFLRFNHNDIYQLRSNDRNLYLGKPKTDFMKNSFSYRRAFARNDLPNNVFNGYNELSTRSFKTSINNHFDALGRC